MAAIVTVAGALGAHSYILQIYKNGISTGSLVLNREDDMNVTAALVMEGFTFDLATAGDYYETYFFQNTGVGQTAAAGTYQTWMLAAKLSN